MISNSIFKNNFAYLIIGYYLILSIYLFILNAHGNLAEGLFTCIGLICSFPLVTSWLVLSEFISKTKSSEIEQFSGEIQKRFAYFAYIILILLFLGNIILITIHNVFKPMGSDIKFLTYLIGSQSLFGGFYQWLSKEIFLK